MSSRRHLVKFSGITISTLLAGCVGGPEYEQNDDGIELVGNYSESGSGVLQFDVHMDEGEWGQYEIDVTGPPREIETGYSAVEGDFYAKFLSMQEYENNYLQDDVVEGVFVSHSDESVSDSDSTRFSTAGFDQMHFVVDNTGRYEGDGSDPVEAQLDLRIETF